MPEFGLESSIFTSVSVIEFDARVVPKAFEIAATKSGSSHRCRKPFRFRALLRHFVRVDALDTPRRRVQSGGWSRQQSRRFSKSWAPRSPGRRGEGVESAPVLPCDSPGLEVAPSRWGRSWTEILKSEFEFVIEFEFLTSTT